jgi:hypothetical protein
MSKLTATLHGFYVKNGRNVYRYLVNGTKEALEAYEEAQGSNHRVYENPEDSNDKLNGTPLFFSPRPEGKNINLEVTPNAKVIIAKDVVAVMEQDMMFQDKVSSELAKIAAQQQAIRMKLVGQPA